MDETMKAVVRLMLAKGLKPEEIAGRLQIDGRALTLQEVEAVWDEATVEAFREAEPV